MTSGTRAHVTFLFPLTWPAPSISLSYKTILSQRKRSINYWVDATLFEGNLPFAFSVLVLLPYPKKNHISKNSAAPSLLLSINYPCGEIHTTVTMIYTANSSPSTNLQWLSTLNTDDIPTKNYRKSSIIGTIGEYTYPQTRRRLRGLVHNSTSPQEVGVTG